MPRLKQFPGIDVVEVWILTALAAAVFSSLKASLQKYLTGDYSSTEIGFMRSLVSLLFLAPVGIWAYFQYGLSMDPLALLGIFISGFGNLLGIYLMLEAFAIEDISVVSPLRRTTPLWVVAAEPLLLGISYSVWTVIGAALAVVGGYIVLVEDGDLLKPFKPSNGALLALAVSLIIAGVAIAERYATQQINPLLFSFLVYVILASGYTLMARRNHARVGRTDFMRWQVVAVGLAAALGILSIFYSFSLAAASRVVTVKQAVIIFNVAAGGIFFSEEDIGRKLLGSLLIIAGIVLVI